MQIRMALRQSVYKIVVPKKPSIKENKRVKRVLFLCTGNSCRSQMAEGIANHYLKGMIEAKSAGVEPTSLNPYAVKVMAENGIDISHHTVNCPEDFIDIDFDYVITLCDQAKESCPVFLNAGKARKIHWSFPDPAKFKGSEEEILAMFRKIRDDLCDKIVNSLFMNLIFSEANFADSVPL